ncbi:MAG: SAM-dependent methyltransferase [Ruthenibacterium lactatiformans]
MVDENAHVEVRGHDIRYVSRGGLKLERRCRFAHPGGKVCMDIGASQGGFTGLHAAERSCKGICCGRGLRTAPARTLRCDKRVVNMERTNIRHVTAEQLQEPVAFSAWMFPLFLSHIFPVALPSPRRRRKVSAL